MYSGTNKDCVNKQIELEKSEEFDGEQQVNDKKQLNGEKQLDGEQQLNDEKQLNGEKQLDGEAKPKKIRKRKQLKVYCKFSFSTT